MKKILSVVLIAFTFAFSLSIITKNNAEARWQYVGNNSNGESCYLDTDSVSIRSRSPWSFTCTAKAGKYTHYLIYFQENGSPYFKFNRGKSSYPVDDYTVANSIYNYVINYY